MHAKLFATLTTAIATSCMIYSQVDHDSWYIPLTFAFEQARELSVFLSKRVGSIYKHATVYDFS